MDHEAQRKKRLEEMELKKKRLEEMRKSRKEKTDNPSDGNNTPNTSSVSEEPPSHGHEAQRSDVEALVNSLLATEPVKPPTQPEEAKATVEPKAVTIQEKVVSQIVKNLSTVHHTAQFSFTPKDKEQYDKELQTDVDEYLYISDSHDHEDVQRTPHRRRADSQTKIQSPVRNPSFDAAAEVSIPKKEFDELEKNEITSTDRFKEFLVMSSRVVDRSLTIGSTFDILQDYKTDTVGSKSKERVEFLSCAKSFRFERAENRPIHEIHSSPHHAELFLVSYGAPRVAKKEQHNDFSTLDTSSGLVCVWSTISSHPEFVFNAPSSVLIARFHPVDAHLIVGACYNGQILLWDTRSKSSKPVQKSNSTGKGHKHPVFSLCLASSGLSTSIFITASNDGTFCQWDVSNLSEPLNTLVLTAPVLPAPLLQKLQHTEEKSSLGKTAPVYASCMALGPDEEGRKLLIGSEGGFLYSLTLPLLDNAPLEQVQAHYGYITSISVNPHPTNDFLKNIVLTSSVDWSIKLWNIKPELTYPLFQFNSPHFNYFTCVEWCPNNSAIFAAASSGGYLILWNLCKSTVDSIGMMKVCEHDDNTKDAHSALDKLLWDDDGRKIYTGDSNGITRQIVVRPVIVEAHAGDDELLSNILKADSNKIATSIITTVHEGTTESKVDIQSKENHVEVW